MKIDLSGKTALVTGSTAGIGHAIAKGLAASGASVVINGRGQDKVDAAVRKLEGIGGKVRGIAADVSTAAGCKALAAALSEGVETFVKDLAKQNGQSVDEAAANFVKQHRPSSLIQRFASVDEIANMVVYVASKEASATNGAALRAEGGIVNTIA